MKKIACLNPVLVIFLRTPFIIAVLTAFLIAAAPVMAAEPPQQATVSETRIDINSADAEAIAAALDGVGLTRAREIVAFRQMHGKFQSVDQLSEVNGIGPATVERNRHRILISAE